MITQAGGLWDASCKIYPQMQAVPNKSEHSWQFPSGAKVKFAHLQYDLTVHDWQSSEICLIEFDELTTFEEGQFWYMLSRNRSTCGVKPYVRAGCNPDADSWVAGLLAWWIDQHSGQPIPQRAGACRWFVRVNDRLEWADSPEELQERYPDIPPKSLSFVPARLTDNAALMAADPGYLANLLALPYVEKERLLGGNWLIRPATGLVFNRAWFEIVGLAPIEAQRVRAWDKAGSSGKGDWTVGVRLARTEAGLFYVEDVVRGQWSALERNRVIQQTAQLDGESVEIWLEQEPGSGGLESAEISVRQLAGYIVHAERATGDKLTRARQFSAQCEAHNVKLVWAPWNECFLRELHGFDGKAGGLDDQVDASAMAFNKLAQVETIDFGDRPSVDARDTVARAPRGVFLDGGEEDYPEDEY